MESRECPVCETPYHDLNIISIETRFDNHYPGAFFDLMTSYRRRCSSKRDVESGEYVGHDEIVVYFHKT